jgi:uncharacterized protein YjbI with pentapeptide repeats
LFFWRTPVNCRLASINASLLLAVALGALALFDPSPAAAARRSVRHPSKPAPQALSEEAQALNEADKKLAALAKEAKDADAGSQKSAAASPGGATSLVVANLNGADTQGASSGGTSSGKKSLHKAKKKRLSKARRSESKVANEESVKKVQNVVDRRLTRAEVLNILTTTRDFSGSDLSGLNLAGIDFNGAKFNRANLKTANFTRADLTESDLELADLSGADLRGASLNQARLRGTKLEATRMDGALWVDKMVCKQGSIGNCIED